MPPTPRIIAPTHPTPERRGAGERPAPVPSKHLRRGTATVVAALLGAAAALVVPAAAVALPYQEPGLPVATRVADLLSRMSLDEKIGQMTQAERAEVSTADITNSRLGSILSGGGSAPSPNNATSWANMYDSYQNAALATPLGIPMIYGSDAVHGHNNVVGATIFPHNIGLGATRNPALAEQVGRAVAEEVSGTGVDWTFAPCLCVARDDRWGRTYESFGEKPELPVSMATIINGFQGTALNAPGSILANAKHYIGDGGTTGGDDQGNTQLSEAELRAIHLPPFAEAIRRGVGSVMISFSSWNGAKLHGHSFLINTVLKGELGFTGFVVSDWNGIDQLDGAPGFTASEVAQAVNAGIDMVMVPEDWRAFITALRGEVQAGRVSMARIDDANRRILTKKFELGLFERPLTDRTYTATVGSAAHRALARQAVRESQVLLKNQGNVLPLARGGNRIFVAGKNADNIGHQSGGWTVTWQGGSGATTPGTTILQGIRSVVDASTTVTFNATGTGIDSSYRAAIAVVGETPYAEGRGDRTGSMSLDAADLQVISRLRAAGVPVIVVLVSGRPLDIGAELPNWNALLASWLPGTEGGGVADVLFGLAQPTGRLPMTWMQNVGQQPINDGDGKAALFPYGFGLAYQGTEPQPPTRPGTPVASSVAATSVGLSWTASTGSPPVTGYRVFREAGATDVQVGMPTTPSFTVTGLTPATAYEFYVVAFNAAGDASPASAPVAVTTLSGGDTSAPTAPGLPVASGVTSSSVGLSWAAATDNVGVTGYTVFREAGATDVPVATPAGVSATVSGLAASTTYQFYVVARDAAGNTSPPSPPVTVTTSGGGTGPSCAVAYSVNDWGSGGFGATIQINNTGSAAITGWTLRFTFPGTQRVTNGWEGTWTQSGAEVTAVNAGWNGTIAAGANVRIGFNGSYTGSNPSPTAFTVNGTACAVS